MKLKNMSLIKLKKVQIMNNKYNNIPIENLNLNKRIINKLKENDIFTVSDLRYKKRDFLKNINLSNEDINMISIRLQLLGIDLNKKVY